MQENEFEKQVKEMMEGFWLTPSDTAWENISRKLKKERPRRLPFIFLLTLSILVTAGFIFYFTKEKMQEPVITTKSGINTANADSNTLKGSSDNSFVQKEEPVNNNTALSRTDKTGNLQTGNTANAKNERVSFATTSSRQNKNLPGHRNDIISGQQNVSFQPPVISLNDNDVNDSNIPVNSGLAFTETADSAKRVQHAITDDNTLAQTNATPDSVLTAPKEDDTEVIQQAKKTVASKNSIPKWQWGVNASYGGSNAVKSLTNTNKSQQQYLSFPTAINNGGGVVYHNEYVYTPSNTYSFGFDVQRKILKNAVLVTGLNFTHISTESDVSRKVDSAYSLRSSTSFSGDLVNGYFPPGVSSVYKNTYNFIELPLYFQQDFLKQKQFSFSYNAGVSLRQMISSKSLIYNESDNIYFSKNDMLRKTQFQFLAGLNFKFNTGKATSVYVGPQFSYSLSNMLKNNEYGNFHFMTYSIKAGLLLHRK